MGAPLPLFATPAVARRILGIDPGTSESAVVVYDPELRVIHRTATYPNQEMVEYLGMGGSELLAVEMIASYGMAVGREVFETCVWIGRFVEAWAGEFRMVYRKEVCKHICGTPHAKDPNVRRALLDLFPASGGGATPQVGTKSNPGPLFGISSHLWSALAVAITAAETEGLTELARPPARRSA